MIYETLEKDDYPVEHLTVGFIVSAILTSSIAVLILINSVSAWWLLLPMGIISLFGLLFYSNSEYYDNEFIFFLIGALLGSLIGLMVCRPEILSPAGIIWAMIPAAVVLTEIYFWADKSPLPDEYKNRKLLFTFYKKLEAIAETVFVFSLANFGIVIYNRASKLDWSGTFVVVQWIVAIIAALAFAGLIGYAYLKINSTKYKTPEVVTKTSKKLNRKRK